MVLDDAKGKPQCFVALRGDAEIVVNGAVTALPASSAVIVPALAGTVTIRAARNVEVVRATP